LAARLGLTSSARVGDQRSHQDRCSRPLSLEGHRIPGDITDDVVHRAQLS
jgi:hypothetical protein